MKKMIDKKLFIENNDVSEFVVLKYSKTSSQHKKTTDKGLIDSISERYIMFCISIIGFSCTSSELKSLRNSRAAWVSVVLRRKRLKGD